jgi:exodeoxyribonuclease VII large subunit
VSYRKVLSRGYAVVRGPDGVLTRAAAVAAGLSLDIEFADGHVAAESRGTAASGADKPRKTRPKRKPPSGDDPQGTLL